MIMRLASTNGIRDKIVGKWIIRLALANGIRVGTAGKWSIRLATTNGVHVRMSGNDRQSSIHKGYPCLDDLEKLISIIT